MKIAKALVATAAAALTAMQSLIPMSAVDHGWVAVGLATLGAAGVYLVPNAPQEPTK